MGRKVTQCACVLTQPSWPSRLPTLTSARPGWLEEPCESNRSVSHLPSHPSDSKLELGTVPFSSFYLLPSHLHPTTFTLKNSSPIQATPQSQCLLGQGCGVLVTCVGTQYSVDILSNKT